MPKPKFICRLEDTLIDLYLSGYTNQTADAAMTDLIMPVETNDTGKLNVQPMVGEILLLVIRVSSLQGVLYGYYLPICRR